MFVIPELKRSMGRLTINSTPKEVPIVVDGKQLGLTPCSIDLESGKHYISCETYGCVPYRKNVEIEGGLTKTETITLDYINDEYKNAYQGDKDAMHRLTILSWQTNIYERKDYEEALFWRERLERYHLLEHDEYNDADYVLFYCIVDKPEKAITLYNSVPTAEYLKFDILRCISDAFIRKKEYDQAIIYLKKRIEEGVGAEENGVDGINGAYKDLGDCYQAKGDKQQAISYYRKYLNVTRSYDMEELDEVKKKIRELEK
jgi:tetratricopeptide (TPR) repeat protein